MADLSDIDVTRPPSGGGCVECDSSQPPGWWFHLRRCAACGHVGCCDSSPGQHATSHYRLTGHRYIQSYEPGEEWFYDFDRERVFSGPVLAAPRSHPSSQTAPGPAGRVPTGWMAHLHR